MNELLQARADRDTVSTSRLIIVNRVYAYLPRQARNRVRAIATGVSPPCPTDVWLIDQIVDFATWGVLPT